MINFDLRAELPDTVFTHQAPLPQDMARERARAARVRFQAAMLDWYRGNPGEAGLQVMHDVLVEMLQDAGCESVARLWWAGACVAGAMLEGEISATAENKQLYGRLDRQIKRLADAGEAVFTDTSSDELMKCLLSCIAAAESSRPCMRLIKTAYRLEDTAGCVDAAREDAPVNDGNTGRGELRAEQPFDDAISAEPQGATQEALVKSPGAWLVSGLQEVDDAADEEIMAVFIEEADEVLAQLDEQIPAWLETPDNLQRLAEVRRGFHTLKGCGRIVGALALAEFAWIFESLLTRYEEGTLEPDAEAHALVTRSVPVLVQLLERVRGGTAVPCADADEIAHRVMHLSGSDAAPDAPDSAVAQERPDKQQTLAQSPSVVAPAAAATLPGNVVQDDEVSQDADPYAALDSELFEIFIEEASEIIDAGEDTLRAWAEQPGDSGLMAEFQRQLHTLKGGARMVDITPIGDLSHTLESLLSRVADGQVEVDADLFVLLHDSHDHLAEMLEHVKARRIPADAGPLKTVLDIHGLDTEVAADEGDACVVAADATSEPIVIEAAPIPDVVPNPIEIEAAPIPDVVPDLVEIEAAPVLDVVQDLVEIEAAPVPDVVPDPVEIEAAPIPDVVPDLVEIEAASVPEVVPDLVEIEAASVPEVVPEPVEVEAASVPEVKSEPDEIEAVSIHDAGVEPVEDAATVSGDVPDAGPGVTPPIEAEDLENSAIQASPAERPASDDVHKPLLLPQPAERRKRSRVKSEQVRVRADLLDNLVNHAAEINIYRARMEQQISDYRHNLGELDQTIGRLRGQLRQVEIETEAHIFFRHEQEGGPGKPDFDPLELDRYSNMQQLSRSLIESVDDLRSLQGLLENTTRESEALYLQQSRVSADLQEGLLRSRMIPFTGLAPRLRRILRQSAKQLGKEVDLDLSAADGEIDRSIMDRIIAPLEHMLRNSVAHGIEAPDVREKSGKPVIGKVAISFDREGSEILLRIEDDGAGLDIEAIRARAIEHNLLDASDHPEDSEVMQYILQTGFSTAGEVTQISGRGVGMDVVNGEVRQLGGSLHITSIAEAGTTFTMRLPYTLAINQVLLVEAGRQVFCVPLGGIEGVARMSPQELAACYEAEEDILEYAGNRYQLQHLASMLGCGGAESEARGHVPVLLTCSGEKRIAFQLEAVHDSREIVVKPLGEQLRGIETISGATILGDGSVVLILDITSLARMQRHAPLTDVTAASATAGRLNVMVVDDSITVRKITTRLLERNGYQVATAKDGVDALGQLRENQPDIMLLDIEMPRMDGFELATLMRNDPNLRHIPIVMITSRSGDKHRMHAQKIGVNSYLGKPYQESELLDAIHSLIDPDDKKVSA